MVKMITAGRTDVDEYFRLSGVFDTERLTDTPLLVFQVADDAVEVKIIEKPTELLSFPDDTSVMGQWRGEWRSDFFQFKIGQYRKHIDIKLSSLKSAKNVVKNVGPRGGFRSLSYEYVSESGMTTYKSTSNKSEAQMLEDFFAQQGITVSEAKAK